MKKAGINWLALGIESANPMVRDGASKRMKVCDIKNVVRSIQSEGIRVIGTTYSACRTTTFKRCARPLTLRWT